MPKIVKIPHSIAVIIGKWHACKSSHVTIGNGEFVKRQRKGFEDVLMENGYEIVTQQKRR